MSIRNLKATCPMSPIVYRMNDVLSRVVQGVSVGTNLGLFYLLWMLLSGRLLLSRGLVCSNAQPGAPTFSTGLLHDPRFDEPLLLNTALPLTGAHRQAFYRERWPVEGLPLTAKQMLGAARQFVFAPESRQRLLRANLLQCPQL
jgi:hypothetical protein